MAGRAISRVERLMTSSGTSLVLTQTTGARWTSTTAKPKASALNGAGFLLTPAVQLIGDSFLLLADLGDQPVPDRSRADLGHQLARQPPPQRSRAMHPGPGVCTADPPGPYTVTFVEADHLRGSIRSGRIIVDDVTDGDSMSEQWPCHDRLSRDDPGRARVPIEHRDLREGPGWAQERENRIVATFLDLAGGLAGDLGVQDLLHRLAENCVDLVAASACGILLADEWGSLSVLAAYPEAVEALEVLQVRAEEGPCVDCVRSGEAVFSEDLSAEVHRWPRWAPAAMRGGVRGVYAVPLRTADTVIGTLNLFDYGSSGLAEPDLLLLQALADVATQIIVQQRFAGEAGLLDRQLESALNSRIHIEQAKGMVAQSLTVDMDKAFLILRHHSRATSTALSVLAGNLITRQISPVDLFPLPAHVA